MRERVSWTVRCAIRHWWLVVIWILPVAVVHLGCTKQEKNGSALEVAVIYPLTGGYAEYGQYAKEGMDLALRELREENRRLPLNITVEDSRSTPKDGLSALNNVLLRKKVAATVVLGSSIVKAVSPLAAEKNVVTIANVAAADDLFADRNLGFRWYITSDVVSKTMTGFAVSRLDARKFAILYENVDYGISAVKTDSELIGREGKMVILSEGFRSGTTDFRSLLLKVKKVQPDVTLIHSTGGESLANLISQYREIKIAAPIVTDDSVSFPIVAEKVRSGLNGVYYAITRFDPKSPEDELARAFVENYRKAYSRTPTDISAFSYELTRFLAKASLAGVRTSEQAREALAGLRSYESVLGTLSMTPEHDLGIPFVVKVFHESGDSIQSRPTGYEKVPGP